MIVPDIHELRRQFESVTFLIEGYILTRRVVTRSDLLFIWLEMLGEANPIYMGRHRPHTRDYYRGHMTLITRYMDSKEDWIHEGGKGAPRWVRTKEAIQNESQIQGLQEGRVPCH